MFLRSYVRKKNGKTHRYWSVVETRRTVDGRVLQHPVLYLGEINDDQRSAWCTAVAAFDEEKQGEVQLTLFPEDRMIPAEVANGIRVRLQEMQLRNPRQWGNCWLAYQLWQELHLNEFWGARLPPSREGTEWKNVLQALVYYRLIDPGSEWRLYRMWYQRTALGDLLGEDFSLVQKDNLYRCLDKLLPHKEELFKFLRSRWEGMFKVKFDVLLYDLTSTYFEGEPPAAGKRRYGYSRDKRPDCVQVIIALVITPEGFPLAYEVMNGNTSDRTTLKSFLAKIEQLYGKAGRVWIMDRGIPTEEALAEMRSPENRVGYLVGTPRSKLRATEQKWVALPWNKIRDEVEVKLFSASDELFVVAKSEGRRAKEQAIRRRKLVRLLLFLRALRRSENLRRDDLLMKLGGARKEAGRAYRLVKIEKPEPHQPVNRETFRFNLLREKLEELERFDGYYLLRSNLSGENPEVLWQRYMQLVEVEQAFKNLKGDLSLRPIHHQLETRIEAHIFVAFLAYCLHVTLKQHLRSLAGGLTPRAVLDKLATLQMLDVHFPTTDGRWLIMPRYTHPDKDQQLLLEQMKLKLPAQPPPKITGGMIPVRP